MRMAPSPAQRSGVSRTREHPWLGPLLAVAVAGTVGAARPAGAQDSLVVGSAVCRGQAIDTVEVVSQPPALIARSSFTPLRAVLHVLFQSTTTRPDVVRPFLLVDPGDGCDPERLAEAARVLRTLPFIASATLRPLPDSGDRLRLEVETLDEVPLVIGGSWSGGVTGFKFGNENVLGQGLRVVTEWDEGQAFRDGLGVELQKYGAFGRPMVLTFDAMRLPLGHSIDATAGRPFQSNLQRFGWHLGISQHQVYMPFVRAGRPALSLESDRARWTAGAVLRVGGRSLGVFAGPVAMYDRFRPSSDAVIVTSVGLSPPDTNALSNRYRGVTTFRVGAVTGVRLLSWRTVRGIASLDGEQDVARGLQLSVVGARGLSAFGGDGATDWGLLDLYAGVGGEKWFAAVRGDVEGEHPQAGGAWRSIVAGARVATYAKMSERRTWEVSVEYSGGWRAALPLQLSLGQRGGGPRGFEGSDLPAARRLVTRFEERRAMGRIGNSAAWGLTAFVDGARAWAGGVPFGRDLDQQASVGLGVLLAIPPQSRRLIRADVAIPLTSAAADSWRVTVSARDFLRHFWREPGDVTRSRGVALPASVFGWP